MPPQPAPVLWSSNCWLWQLKTDPLAWAVIIINDSSLVSPVYRGNSYGESVSHGFAGVLPRTNGGRSLEPATRVKLLVG
jgi:hypothetical protein